MSFSLRRRLSSLFAPFTLPPQTASENHAASAKRSGSVSHEKQFTIYEKGEVENESFSDESSRKSYELSEIASRRSFDTSHAGSDFNTDDESHRDYSGSDASWDSETDEEVELGDKYDLMASHLYQVAEGKGWFRSSRAWGNSTGIVSIRLVEQACRKPRDYPTLTLKFSGYAGGNSEHIPTTRASTSARQPCEKP